MKTCTLHLFDSLDRAYFGLHVYDYYYLVISNQHYIWQHPMLVGMFKYRLMRNIYLICLVLATILALALRSGDKTSLQLVLFSLALFHTLSFFSTFIFFLHRPKKCIALSLSVFFSFNLVS